MPGTFCAGSLDSRLIVDGRGSLPAEVAFATAPADELAAALGGADRVAGPYNCLLVFSSEGVVLVDAGIGAYAALAGGKLDSDIALSSGQGGAAVGHVVPDLSTNRGRVTFSAGTGRFAGFRAHVAVSLDKDGVWHWDGRYTFARSDQDRDD